MGNAHAWRHRNGYGKPCAIGCIHCKLRPRDGHFKNKNGHRHNPAANKKMKK